jgi:hypothetical protein
MTRPILPQETGVPQSAVKELHALFHEGSDAEPDLMLDQRILAAARADLAAGRRTQARRPSLWWKGWLAPASAIAVAVAVLGLSLGWHVMDQQERDLRSEINAAVGAGKTADEGVGRAAPEVATTETQSSINLRPPSEPRAGSKAVQDLPSAEQEQAAARAARRQATPASPAAPLPVAPAALPPLPVTEQLKKSGRAADYDLRQKREADDTGNAASGLASGQGRIEAKRRDASSSAVTAADLSSGSAASPADDAATPEAWLKRIRELRAEGRNAEAAQSLARLRVRYPDLVLPDDLINPK